MIDMIFTIYEKALMVAYYVQFPSFHIESLNTFYAYGETDILKTNMRCKKEIICHLASIFYTCDLP